MCGNVGKLDLAFFLTLNRHNLLIIRRIHYLPVTSISHCYRESYPLTPLPDEVGGVITEGPQLLLAAWTPKGHGLITVKDYDIYYRPAPRSSTGYLVTDTGTSGTIYNGVPDWLYEGMFHRNSLLSTGSPGTGIWAVLYVIFYLT